MPKYILIIGACGQIGTELTLALREKYGNDQVIASDIMESGPFEILDATNYDNLEEVIAYYDISEIYLMAAMLSATAEKFPMRAWNLNMNTLFNVLNLAKEKKVDKIFWPSSIAVFGPTTPKENRVQCMVSVSNLANVGANIISINSMSMYAVFATLDLLAGKPCLAAEQPIML